MRTILVLIVASTLLLADAVPSLVLTSVPSSSQPYCPGPVLFTCNATDITVAFQWEVNDINVGGYTANPTDRSPLNLTVTSPLIDFIQIDHITIRGTSLDIISTLRVSNLSVLEGSSLHCEDLLHQESNTVNFAAIRQGPPPPLYSSIIECSIASSLASIFFIFDSNFNSQYRVEGYKVTVTPDPSSCSSHQVSPSENYSCSGLDPMTKYTITVSAINCGDQEEMISSNFLSFNAPSAVNFSLSLEDLDVRIDWMEQQGSNICNIPMTYTVEILGENGEVVRTLSVSSSNCSDGNCSVIFLMSEQYVCVSITANSTFGDMSEMFAIDEKFIP